MSHLLCRDLAHHLFYFVGNEQIIAEMQKSLIKIVVVSSIQTVSI